MAATTGSADTTTEIPATPGRDDNEARGMAPSTTVADDDAGNEQCEGVRRSDPRRWWRRAGVTTLFCVLAVLMVRPTWHEITTSVPANLGDPPFIGWFLAWGWHASHTSPLHMFDANVFWPYVNTLAWSESMLPAVPVFGLLFVLSGNPLFAMNMLMLGLLLVALLSTYALTRWLTSRTDAAIVAAVAFGFTGFMLGQWGHMHLWAVGFLPLGFLLLFRLLEDPTYPRAVVLALVNTCIMLLALYFGALWALCVPVVLITWCVRHRPRARMVGTLAVCGVLTAALAIPALLPYQKAAGEQGLERPLDPTLYMDLKDLATPPAGSFVWEEILPEPEGGVEHVLFPGMVVSVLALVGFTGFLVTRRREATDLETTAPDAPDAPDAPGVTAGSSPIVVPDRRVFVWALLNCGLVSFVVALGAEFHGFEGMPFRYLHDYVPGFTGIRGASRLVVVAVLAWTVLAGIGYAWVTSAVVRRRALAWTICGATVALVCMELAAPLGWEHFDRSPERLAVYEALAEAPDGAVVELPMPNVAVDPDAWAYLEAPRTLYSSWDWHPRLNGYSGYIPSAYSKDVETMSTFPSPESLELLAERRVRYVVLHEGMETAHLDYDPLWKDEISGIVDYLPEGATAERHGDAWLVDLGPVPTDRPEAPPLP